MRCKFPYFEDRPHIPIALDNADGSSFHAKKFVLTVDVEGYKFRAGVCFVENNRSSMPLLGRADIFDHFKITIDEKRKFVELKTHS